MVAKNIAHLNRQFAEAGRDAIKFGIGINGGEVIVGDIGYGDHISFTALGDAVNVAARLQDLTKELACQIVVSDEVYSTAGLPDDAVPLREIAVRGRAVPVAVRTIADAESLTAMLEATDATSAAAE